jgi:opacity protein-like surface antigen
MSARMPRMRKTLCRSLFLFCLSSSVLAQGNWFAGIGAGATFLNVDNNHFISSGEGWPDDKYHNTGVDATGLLVLDGGYQWARNSVWLPFYSLAVSYTYGFPAKVKGKVEQYSLPEFTNYNYQYKIQTQTFLAQIKADLYRWRCLMPFLLAGAGVSLNNASNYAEQPVPGVTPRISPGFKGQTNTYFSYVFGAGLDYIVQKNIWASLTYEYSNLGRAQTGSGVNTVTLTGTNYASDNLKTNVKSNAVFLSVTYLFDPVA